MAAPANPSVEKYFFGRISREEAEQFLNNENCREGLFLLREKVEIGNYALSLCHGKRIHHYSIERQPDNKVMIQDGKRFIGPVELVRHHTTNLDGFLTRPTIPCERPPGYPIAWPGVTYLELEQALVDFASKRKLTGNKLENALGPQRQHFIGLLAKDFHREQAWFHDKVSREDAEKIIEKTKHSDGKYLVREKDDGYALSLSYHGDTKHYKIRKEKDPGGEIKMAIEDGPKFISLMDMIAHYHNKTDGLLCKLTAPVVRKNWKRTQKSFSSKQFFRSKDILPTHGDRSPAYGLLPADDQSVRSHGIAASNISNGFPPTPPGSRLSGSSHSGRPLPPMPSVLDGGRWDEPESAATNGIDVPGATAAPSREEEDLQKIYDFVPRTEDVFNLNKRDLDFRGKLGQGNFGDVMKGEYKRGAQKIPVAIKTLKHDDIPNAEAEDTNKSWTSMRSEIMKEAKLMADLQHRNIVRLIGVCKSETLMLVMELAPLGPLNKYLKSHTRMSMTDIVELMYQVADGMAYLESRNFVHRDLAARNVLLVNERFAKISDFGMSKALGLGNNYYKAEHAGKWPLKWYAPECIYYFKFDSKSDIWSYGVTLWEACSFGAKPYRGLRGQQILEKIEQGARLEQPANCPDGVYEVMLQCWEYEKENRPNFHDITHQLYGYR